MCPHDSFPEWPHLLCKPSVIMAGPGHLFGRFSLLGARVTPCFGWQKAPGTPTRDASVTREKGPGIPPGPGIALTLEGGSVTPPLPRPPRLRPRPPLRWAWDQIGRASCREAVQ